MKLLLVFLVGIIMSPFILYYVAKYNRKVKEVLFELLEGMEEIK